MPADLPAVRADRTAIGMALDNLLDNAIRYSGPARHLSIRARRERDRRLALEVADRGEGIPADQIEQVTRRFFRGRRSEIGGSGLGLAIVSRIVADHGGEMSIESRSGAGTTVRLSLPIAEEQP
jgi:signal transduction histidine kinase